MMVFKNSLGMSRMTHIYADVEEVIVDDTILRAESLKDVHDYSYRKPTALHCETVFFIGNNDTTMSDQDMANFYGANLIMPDASNDAGVPVSEPLKGYSEYWPNRCYRQVFLKRNGHWERHIVNYQAFITNEEGKTIERVKLD